MAITPGNGHLGSRFTRFVYTDAYGAERETHGALLAVNRRESNKEGIVLYAEGTRGTMCLVRENDDGVPAWVAWVDRIPGKDEGWYEVRLPGQEQQDGWSDVIAWFVLLGIVVCILYGTGNL